MRRLGPVAWLALAIASTVLLGVTWLMGVFSSGLDITETCASVGRPLDRAYHDEHLEEAQRWFPLSSKCDADYDLVPVWVNPAIVVLSSLSVACVGATVWSAASRLRMRREKS
ncbi:hypothetical protein [Streptomyces jumonjinensis]|uniref:hypothetical protein n=1 Tax=Streptomyces jumonjinensis TaxID=1945 RepID=UPI0037B20DCF